MKDNQTKDNTDYTKQLGAAIKKIREDRFMTREQVISRMELPCSRENLRKYEDGSLRMDVEMFFALTKALCITPNDLAPKTVMDNAASALGDYARLNSRNKKVTDNMIAMFLKSQRATVQD